MTIGFLVCRLCQLHCCVRYMYIQILLMSVKITDNATERLPFYFA